MLSFHRQVVASLRLAGPSYPLRKLCQSRRRIISPSRNLLASTFIQAVSQLNFNIESSHHMMSDRETDYETSIRVLENILEESGKRYVCPLCRSTYSRVDAAFGHCREEGAKKKDGMSDTEKRKRDIHENLGAVTMGGSFRKFRESLATACGRSEIPIDKLPLTWTKSGRRSYGSCLGTKFVVKHMATVEGMAISMVKKLEILKVLLHKAGIHCACPACWIGFSKSEYVTEHCALERGECHQGLVSKEVKPFAKLYGELLGKEIDLAHMEVKFDGHGVPDFHKSFCIDKILGHLGEYWKSLRYKLT